METEIAPYKLSRAALRKKYGARSIDASAPQSSRDTTPSGRAAFLMDRGATPDQAKGELNDRWRRRFPAPGAAPNFPLPDEAMRPMATGPLRSPKTALEAIEQANQGGASFGSFLSPYGPVSFDRRPSLMPTAAASDASEYLSGFASREQSPLSFFKPKPRPSILSGAQKWLASI